MLYIYNRLSVVRVFGKCVDRNFKIQQVILKMVIIIIIVIGDHRILLSKNYSCVCVCVCVCIVMVLRILSSLTRALYITKSVWIRISIMEFCSLID